MYGLFSTSMQEIHSNNGRSFALLLRPIRVRTWQQYRTPSSLSSEAAESGTEIGTSETSSDQSISRSLRTWSWTMECREAHDPLSYQCLWHYRIRKHASSGQSTLFTSDLRYQSVSNCSSFYQTVALTVTKSGKETNEEGIRNTKLILCR